MRTQPGINSLLNKEALVPLKMFLFKWAVLLHFPALVEPEQHPWESLRVVGRKVQGWAKKFQKLWSTNSTRLLAAKPPPGRHWGKNRILVFQRGEQESEAFKETNTLKAISNKSGK